LAAPLAQAYIAFAAGEKAGVAARDGPSLSFPSSAGRNVAAAPRFRTAIPCRGFTSLGARGRGSSSLFVRRARQAEQDGRLRFLFRHRVDALSATNGAVDGASGAILEPSPIARGQSSSRISVGQFELKAQVVIVASGGIGGNADLVRANWPARLGKPPQRMVCGVPAHVDGRMIGIAQGAGARLINRDRMWHYVEGVHNWAPIWPSHGIRILPGPSSLWFDAKGERLPRPLYPGYDTLATLEHIMRTGYDYSWFVTNQTIVRKEFSLSGSEQNPDLTGRDWRLVARRAVGRHATAPVEAFKSHGVDFLVKQNLADLVAAMNALAQSDLLKLEAIQHEIEARDREIANPFTKDAQIMGIHNARQFLGDKFGAHRATAPHPRPRPWSADRRAPQYSHAQDAGRHRDGSRGARFRRGGRPCPRPLCGRGSGPAFGGGGMHGYRSLEGTFLGGCLFSGRTAGRAAAKAAG